MHAPATSGRTPRRIRFLAIGVVAVLGFSACGSDEDSSSDETTATSDAGSTDSVSDETVSDASTPDASTPDVSIPDVTLPDGVSVPGSIAGLGEECQAYYQLFASAFAGDTGAVADLDDAVENLQAQVPDELKGDVEIVAEAISKLVELSSKYEGNPTGLYSDPEALALFGDPAFTDAQQNVSAWLQTECGAAG